MRANKSNAMRAVNDVLLYDETETAFVHRLYRGVYDGIFDLSYYMSKTMRAHIFDIANAITTAVVYKLYNVHGGDNEHSARQYLRQYKCLRVLCDNLCTCLSIHDLPDEILSKVETIGKTLFNFINKYY